MFLGTGVKAGATPQNSKNFHDIRFKTSKHKFVYKGDFIMVSKELVLTNAQGFHMRPASVFATAMGKYSCDVTIKFNGKPTQIPTSTPITTFLTTHNYPTTTLSPDDTLEILTFMGGGQ